MLNSYYTEKLLGLQGVVSKNMEEKEESHCITHFFYYLHHSIAK